MIEVAEIRGVNGCTREKSRRERRQGLGRMLEQRRGGATVKTDKVGAKAGRFDDLVGSTFAAGEFGDGTSRSVAVDLDLSHDQVTNCEGCGGSGSVGTFAMNSVAFLSEQTKDLLGELGCGAGETKKGMNIGSLLLSRSRSRSEAQIKPGSDQTESGKDDRQQGRSE